MIENCAVDDCQKRELLARIEDLEAALRRSYDFLQDKSFTPDSLTHECTKVVEQIEAALTPQREYDPNVALCDDAEFGMKP